MNPARKPMGTFDYWKPRTLEEDGTQQTTEARNLFETYGADLDPSNFVIAENLLSCAEDLGRLLREKRNILARFRVARRYKRRAREVLRTIEGMTIDS